MKQRIFLAMLIIVVLAISCDKVLDDLGFNIKTDYYEFEFQMYPSAAGEFIYNDVLFPRNVDSILKAKGHSVSMLETIQFEELHFSIDDTSNIANYNAIDDLFIILKAPGLIDTVAWIYSVPNQVDSINLSVTKEEVMDYLYDDKVAIEIGGLLDAQLLDTIVMTGYVNYTLGLKR